MTILACILKFLIRIRTSFVIFIKFYHCNLNFMAEMGRSVERPQIQFPASYHSEQQPLSRIPAAFSLSPACICSGSHRCSLLKHSSSNSLLYLSPQFHHTIWKCKGTLTKKGSKAVADLHCYLLCITVYHTRETRGTMKHVRVY